MKVPYEKIKELIKFIESLPTQTLESLGLVNIHTINRDYIPKENETFRTDFTDEFFSEENLSKIQYVRVYYRSKEECPFNRGNVIIYIFFIDNIQCIKLPLEMTEEHVNRYIQPLYDELNKLKMKDLH